MTDHHAQGQKDASQGKYEPPHTITPADGVLQDKHTWDKLVEDNRQYDDGFKNAQKQR